MSSSQEQQQQQQQHHQHSRRQIMQPWPLCLVSFGQKPKERATSSKYYSRVPSNDWSSTATSSLAQDCASNSTLLTNVSPFNSQVALISQKSGSNKNQQPQEVEQHYYAENLRNNHHRTLNGSQIYDPLRKLDRELEHYKQLDPLLSKEEASSDTRILMDSQDFKKPEITVIKTGFDMRHLQDKPKTTSYVTQVLAAFAVSMGSMVVGFASSYTSPALTTMMNRTLTSFEVTQDAGSWIGSIMPLSALFGGIAGGPLIEYVGRRNTILFTAFPFGFAWLLIGLAYNITMVMLGRAISGFCVGVASLSLPVYLGETIQPEVRGSLGLLPTAFGNIGILLCFTTGMYLDWSKLALFGALLPIPFALLMIMIPETPRWYISKGKTKRARKSLQWLRGRDADVSDELTTVEKLHVESERQAASQDAFSDLFKGSNFKPLLISLGLMFFQQMSGINAVIFYTVSIFKDAGSSVDSNVSTIIVGIVNFASTFVATALIDRLGRKILLYMSSVSMFVSLFVLSIFFYMKNQNMDVTEYGYIPLTSFVIYVIGFSLGFGPIPWLMMGEILPAKIRGSAASVATSFNWTCTFLVTKFFVDIVKLIGQEGTFCIFGVICVCGLIFVISFVPETSGRSLEEIERGLTGPVRRMSAVANMKPTPMAC